jgi:hypothetical protein
MALWSASLWLPEALPITRGSSAIILYQFIYSILPLTAFGYRLGCWAALIERLLLRVGYSWGAALELYNHEWMPSGPSPPVYKTAKTFPHFARLASWYSILTFCWLANVWSPEFYELGGLGIKFSKEFEKLPYAVPVFS